MKIQKRVALITGANRGIGLAIGEGLSKLGYHVILGSRNFAKGQEAATKLLKNGLEVEVLELDVASDASCDQARDFIVKKFNRLDVLVNNAGVLLDPPRHPPSPNASVFAVDPEVIRKSWEVNTLGALRLIQRFYPLMKAQWYGRIVNVSSGMGQLEDMNGGWTGYRLSKLALNGLTRIVANECEGQNVLINSVCPGWVQTEMGGKDADLTPEQGADTVIWAATLPDEGPSGGFFREREELGW